MKIHQILEKVKVMKLIFDPSWVDGCPNCPGPIIHEALGDYIVAGLLRDIAFKLRNKSIQEVMLGLSKRMVAKSSKGLLVGWENGDDICPPWWPFPPKSSLQPQPVPWYWNKLVLEDEDSGPSRTEIAGFSTSMEEVMLAGALKQLATLTTDPNFSREIFIQGQELVKEASATLLEEYRDTVPNSRSLKYLQRSV